MHPYLRSSRRVASKKKLPHWEKEKHLHPGRLTWNLRIHPWKIEKENHLPTHHFQVLC